MSDGRRRDDPERLPGVELPASVRARRMGRPFGHVLVFGVLLAASAYLAVQKSPLRAELTAVDLGQPAKFDVRVKVSSYVPDTATTKRLRDEASRAIPLVYRRTPGVLERQLETLRAAFKSMRVGFDAYDRAVDLATAAPDGAAVREPKDGESGREAARSPKGADVARESDIVEGSHGRRPPAIAHDGPTTAAGRALPDAIHGPIAKRLFAFLAEHGAEVGRQLALTTSEVDTLARTRFSASAEEIVARLLSAVQGGVIVRDKVKFLVDVSSGVTLQSPLGGAPVRIEKVLRPIEALDVEGARTKIGELARETSPELPAVVREALAAVARRLVAENVAYDAESTKRERSKARAAVPGQYRYYPHGSVLLRQGDIVRPEHLAIMDATSPGGASEDVARSYVGTFLLLALLCGVAFATSRTRMVRRRLEVRDYLFLACALLLSIAIARVSVEIGEILHDRWQDLPRAMFSLGIPFAVGAMLVRLVLSIEVALLWSAVNALVLAIMSGGGPALAIYAFVGSLVGAQAAGRARQRGHIIRAGLWAAAAHMVAALCLALAGGQGGFPTAVGAEVALPEQGLFAVSFLLELASAASSGVVASLLTLGLAAVAEPAFGYNTVMKYQELGSLENPLLKDLFMRAPGTYHHSVVAGALAEAAADAIGANGALAKVGAYFHDVGKGKCPHYFAENQREENPHDRLAPHMSALILRRHVEDGVAILEEARLPRPIIDICAQHLGTTLTEYFYVKACKLAEEQGLPKPDESEFRYAGPRPQFREAALVFIADSVEAAGRAIPDPTAPKLDAMVRRIIRNKFADGQLDECDLTLRDLDAVARAMARVLVAIHHTRPQYPSQREAEAALDAVGRDPSGIQPPKPDSEPPIDLSDRRRRLR